MIIERILKELINTDTEFLKNFPNLFHNHIFNLLRIGNKLI